MKLSILIPFNKGAEFLKDCFDSIEAQNFEDYEVVLVLDHVGFDDKEEHRKLFTLLDETKVPVKYHTLGDSTGVAAARNLAVSKAEGDYILFLDGDDYLADGYMERMLNRLEECGKDCIIQSAVTEYRYGYETYQSEHTESKEVSDNTHELGTIVRNLSVTGVLAPRALVRDKELVFDESCKYYSDVAFLFNLARGEKVETCPEALYVKRIHNDIITYPQLSQMLDKERPSEFLRVIRGISKDGSCDEREKGCLAFVLCDYLAESFMRGKGEIDSVGYSDKVKNEYAKLIKELGVPMGIKQAFGKKEYKFLKLFESGKVKSASRYAKLSVLKGRKRKGLGGRQQRGRILAKLIFRKLKIKDNYVLFESFLGKQYADSCKFIYEYMQKTYGNKYRYFWFVNDKNIEIPGNAVKVKPFTLRYFYLISRAKYWVNNMRQPEWFVKRPGTVFLETWHGTPLKKLVFDMNEVHSASPTYKMTFYKQSRAWDYLISDNEFSTEVFSRAFKFPKEKILELGYPRNDGLYAKDLDEKAAKIKKKLGIPKDKKVILYAPTWRDDEYYAPGQYKFRLPIDIGLLKERFGDEYVLLLRMHYFIADHMEIHENEKDFAIDVSRYSDIGDLYIAADILVTDYSSVFFDYANLRRPMLFFVYDFEKYRDVLRGFYIDMSTELPGPLLYTNEELVAAIDGIDEVNQKYSRKYEEFTERFCSLDDGHAAERIVEKVFEKK